ncbi:MAG: VIT domain-containing protein [Sandaracinaceae bacterium]
MGERDGRPARRHAWALAFCALAASACGGSRGDERSGAGPSPETAGQEAVPAPPVADLPGAAERPPEPEVPDDTTGLARRMAPKPLAIPATRWGQTQRFTFDGFRRGWFARLPSGAQALLTPAYGQGKVYVGGGFASHQLFAYDARTGDRAWAASAPDGGPSAAIVEDGKILFNTESCTLFAVDAETGRQRWSRWLGDPLMSQPAAGNGFVFSGHVIDGQSPGGLTPGQTGYGVADGRRYGFTALRVTNGAPRWTRAISADVMNAPVLDDTSVYFTTMDGIVQRLRQRDGRVLWRRPLRATSAPTLDGPELHLTARIGHGRERRERTLVLDAASGETRRELEPVDAAYLNARADQGGVQAGWAYAGSRATVVDGRAYQTIGNEVQSRDADTGELLWRRAYTDEVHARPASPPAIAGSQLVFGTQDGDLFALDIDTGMTTWAYRVGEPIAAQPTVAHGWVYAATTRGGLVALEVSDRTFDGWHMWGGNAEHNGPVVGDEAPPEDDERPTEGSLRLGSAPRDGEVPGFVLEGTRVDARVSGYVARVRVTQTFRNPYDRAVEAVYLFPLPDDAAVDAMELRAGDRVVRAVIRRRQQAREEYRDARDRGVLASLLEQERPNLFRQSVANIRPGDTIEVALRYTQVLPYEEGSYRFVYPMVAGPRYAADAGGDDGEGDLRQVVLAPGAERPDRVEVSVDADLGVPLREVTSPTHELAVDRDGPARVRVRLDAPAPPDRDLDLRFPVAGEAPAVSVLAHAPAEDEDGHFTLAVHPRVDVPDGDLMPRELVFLVDTSSSMNGRPMQLAKAAMVTALEGLRPTDTFRVLTFSDRASALSDGALPATPRNVERGRRFVRDLRALGSTEMVRGIEAALSPAAEDGRMRIVLLMTDGYIAEEPEVFRAVDEHLGQSRLFAFGVGSAVNRYLLTRVAEVGRGDVQVVTLDESPEAAARAFGERIARPYLTDLAIDWGDLDVRGAYPRRLPDLFADRPLVVHARYGEGGSGEVTLRGRIAGRPFAQTLEVTLPGSGAERPELASVWARTRIRDLMTAMALRPNPALQEEVTRLGLAHHLLTEWTAFLAIDEGYRGDEPADRVVQPSARPAGTAPAGGEQAQRTDAFEPLDGLVGDVPGPMAPPPPVTGAVGRGAAGVGYGTGYLHGTGVGGGGAVARRSSSARVIDLEEVQIRGVDDLAADEGLPADPAGEAPAPSPDAPAQPEGEEGRDGPGPDAEPSEREEPSCEDLARRPDGTIDQERLEECLRRRASAPRGEAPGPERQRRAALGSSTELRPAEPAAWAPALGAEHAAARGDAPPAYVSPSSGSSPPWPRSSAAVAWSFSRSTCAGSRPSFASASDGSIGWPAEARSLSSRNASLSARRWAISIAAAIRSPPPAPPSSAWS